MPGRLSLEHEFPVRYPHLGKSIQVGHAEQGAVHFAKATEALAARQSALAEAEEDWLELASREEEDADSA